MQQDNFDQNVFINCPFDEDYEPLLQAIIFTILYFDFIPRFATEREDAGEARLAKIVDLIRCSRLSIHDLSRCQAKGKGEYFRLNMPFELGIDYGFRNFGGAHGASKRFLILEEQKYRYQASISDIAGCDIKFHSGEFEKAVRQVRNWLATLFDGQADGAAKVLGAYVDFQEWYYEIQLEAGFSEDDIQDYPTAELLAAMKNWFEQGRPV
ncbi:hypothetical protein [Maritalea sp.]|uniref:hypothetical protein n=1 Tax=Maritalea sp. TaxID=2003361 RepID=UPI0039E3F4A9